MAEIKNNKGEIVSYGYCEHCRSDVGLTPYETDGKLFCCQSCANTYLVQNKIK
jgi:hypothetical protein